VDVTIEADAEDTILRRRTSYPLLRLYSSHGRGSPDVYLVAQTQRLSINPQVFIHGGSHRKLGTGYWPRASVPDSVILAMVRAR